MERPINNVAATAPIFGLRYLEEEDAEITGIVGCLMAEPRDPGDGGGGGGGYTPPPTTYYTTNCDYTDTD
jgi:hypothetical protein